MYEEFDPLTGRQVSTLHREIIGACRRAGKTRYALLECIVDGMRCAYALASLEGYEKALDTVRRGIDAVMEACPLPR